MSRDEILLEGDFELFPNEKNIYHVELKRNGITYYPLNSGRTSKHVKYLHFGDIIGCRCRKSVDPKHSNKAYITIFAYPLKKKLFSDKWIRHKAHVTFTKCSDTSFDGNRKIVEKWRRVILHLCQQLPVRKKANEAPEPDVDPASHIEIDVEKCPVPPKTRLLVLVNPHSGPGKAMQIYQKQVAPMLDEADIQVKLIQTEHAGHATEMMKTIKKSDFSGIVIVSGDGLIYEVINGLMSRDDWQEAMKIPVGCIPGGSGNALSCSINYSAGESVESDIVLHSTFILIKHRIVPMDLVVIEQPKARLYSFLSVTWGLLADIDYESEKYRAIGEARFTLQAVKSIFGMRKYKGKLSFLPISEYIPKSSQSSSNNNSKVILSSKNRRVSLQSLDSDHMEDGFEDRMRSKSVPNRLSRGKSTGSSQSITDDDDDELTDIQEPGILSNGSVESREIEFTLSNGGSLDPAATSAMKSSNSNSSLQDVYHMTKKAGEAVPSNLLPPLNEPVPSDWVTVEDEFISVCATYQTHMNSDTIMAPDAKFSDGLIHLCILKAGIQRTHLFSLMSMLEKGTHVDYPSPYFELVKVLAFRLEPEGEDGVIMVDGEKVECTPLQAQVLPRLANLMAIQ